MFEHPIGLQLFNRPDYAIALVNSLLQQTVPVDPSQLFIFIDGYGNSIYEAKGFEDKTEEVKRIVREKFPSARVYGQGKNLGIAQLHNFMQEIVFNARPPWGVFFEEDIVLHPDYLKHISSLIDLVGDNHEVAKVSCFQVIPSLSHLPRGVSGFYPGRGTQAFAERRSFFEAKKSIVSTYLNLVASESNGNQFLVNTDLSSKLALEGHFLPFFQHDALAESLLSSLNLLHIVTRPDLATDIGVEGVHGYVTPSSKPRVSDDSFDQDFQTARFLFDSQLVTIRAEAEYYAQQRLKRILDGYHVSNSRSAMMKQILRISLKRVKK